MPRRNRNCDREPLNRDRLADDAARIARELTPAEPVTTMPAWADYQQAQTTFAEGR